MHRRLLALFVAVLTIGLMTAGIVQAHSNGDVPLQQAVPIEPPIEHLTHLLDEGNYGTAASLMNVLRKLHPEWLDEQISAMEAGVTPDSTNLNDLRILALAYWADARDALAFPMYESILALDPQNVFAFLFRGSSRTYSGDGMTASADFQQAVNLDGENSDVYSVIGSTQQQMGNFYDALIALDHAVQLDPTDARSHYYRGMALLDNGQPDAAKEEFDLALQYNPAYADAYYDLARAEVDLEDAAEAEEDLNTALILNPSFELALSFRGAMNEWAGERAAAAQDYFEYMASIEPTVVDGGELVMDTPAAVTIVPATVVGWRLNREAGDHVALSAVSPTGSANPVLVLLRPDLTVLDASSEPTPTDKNARIQNIELPESGTYVVLVALADAVQPAPITVTVSQP